MDYDEDDDVDDGDDDDDDDDNDPAFVYAGFVRREGWRWKLGTLQPYLTGGEVEEKGGIYCVFDVLCVVCRLLYSLSLSLSPQVRIHIL